MAENKVKRAGLEAMAVKMLREGMDAPVIAEALNHHCLENRLLDPNGAPWSFSPSTVNRALKPYRDQYKNKAKTKFDQFVDAHIESDLDAIKEAADYHLGVARQEEADHRMRSDAYMKMTKIIFEKIKTAMGGPDEAEVAEKIADEIRKNADPDLMRRIDAISQGAGAQGISGPH